MPINRTQRMIIGVVSPIVFIIAGYGIIQTINVLTREYDRWSFHEKFAPYDLAQTWWAWMILACAIGAFEFFLFRDISKERNK